ncbi:hypothetical protein ABEB36_003341 [Hypothenemus hampei]|uniref:Tudor domain-containing protein n=1 Tax=Hypothenemus hampei TaxID=57062 RepID=A0ABD1FBY9_HYPHA
MDAKLRYFAMVIGQNLDRNILRDEFSQFGDIAKLYIAKDNSFAKVYLRKLDHLRTASDHLNGRHNWKVHIARDEGHFQNRPDEGVVSCNPSPEYVPNNHDRVSNASVHSNSNFEDLEENCFYSGDYVDVNGRPLEVLSSEFGQLYVSLQDIRQSGFEIYPKETFNELTIPRNVELRNFENFLLNQGRQYALKYKKQFNEQEVLDVFERVTAKILNNDYSSGTNRVVRSGDSMNISISTPNNTSKVSECVNTRPPRSMNNFGFSSAKKIAQEQDQLNGKNQKTEQQLKYANNEFTTGFKNTNANSRQQTEKKSCQNNFKKIDVIQNSTNKREEICEENGLSAGSQTNLFNQTDTVDPETSYVKVFKTHSGFEKVNKQQERTTSQSSSSTLSKAQPILEKVNKQQDNTTSESSTTVMTATHSSLERVEKEQDKTVSEFSATALVKAHIERVRIAPLSIHKIKVSYIDPNDNHVFYGQLSENSGMIDDEIFVKLNSTIDDYSDLTNPTEGTVALAHFEDCWYRAVVLTKISNSKFLVDLFDYGNHEIVASPLKEMPQKLKEIPAQAIRFVLEKPVANTLTLDEDREILVVKHKEDMSHVVELENLMECLNKATSTCNVNSNENLNVSHGSTPKIEPKDFFLKDLPVNNVKLQSDELVLIVNYVGTKLILRNRETSATSKEIYQHIKAIQKQVVVKSPKINQLVLCNKDTLEGLHRAVILNIKDNLAEVEYIDYLGREQLSLNSLQNFDEVLLSFPSAFIQINFPALNSLNEQSEAYLSSLIYEKRKLKTVQSNGNFDFLLTFETPCLCLSKKLQEFLKAPELPVKAMSSEMPSLIAEQDFPVLYENMMEPRVVLGKNEYFCYNCDGDTITLMASTEETMEYLIKLEELQLLDNEPYLPKQQYMCLADYNGSWNRAVALSVLDDVVEVLFVDYGNVEKVKKSNLRRFPKELIKIPILGIMAQFDGITITQEVKNRIKDLIPDNESLLVDIKKIVPDEMAYFIEIPSIYDKLKQEGLI